MRKKSHSYSIRSKKKLRLKRVIILIFIFASIFPIFVANLNDKVIKFTEEDQIFYEENLVSSDQGEEIFKLIFGTEAGPDNLDPQNSWSPNSFNVINQVCEGLFTHNLTDPNLSIIPNLATSKGSWLVNDTDTWYTISLRPNVSFHDGTKFNATAVKFTYDRLAYLIDNSMSMAGYLYEYYDPDADISYPIINETVAIDEYTVRFELNKPYGPFEALLCFPASYILSPTSTPQFALIDTLTGDLIGTGPFVYDHYLPDEEVLFHAFEDYWAGRANITILKFALISDYDVSYDKTYSFTTRGEANDGTWEYWNTYAGDHSVAAKDTYQYWCWTDTGTSSADTGPPSGIACIYPETSSPTSDDVFIATLADAEVIDAGNYGLNVTFNTCMRGNSAGHMYFEYWDGDSWEIKDDWPGDAVTTFTAQGPYDFTALENSDFKIRFRVVVGGTAYENDFTFDEVRIYGDSKGKNAKDKALLSGEVDVITNPHVSMFSTFSADPDITLNDAGHDPIAKFLSMNNQRINGTFRKAISYAINYSYIINELEESPAERLKSPLLENLLFANWSFDVATYNVTKARETMQSMGYGVGWDTTFLGTSEVNWSSASFATFNYSYNFGDIFRENLLILLQDNLDKIGIEITDAGMSDSEFANILYQGGGYTWDMLELCWLGWYSDYNDPDNSINSLLTNRTTSFNTAFYDGYLAATESGRDPLNLWDNVQLLMEAALFETNQSIRKPYYDRIQQILVEEDMPWAFGSVSHNYDAFRSHIIGFQSNSIGKLSFYGVTQNSSIAPQTIYLSGNQEWQYFRNANKCTGQGTFSDPYVIEDLVIDAGGKGSAISIENSDVYFRIENCTVYNSESAGIRLYNVDNGDILNNTANNNGNYGISLDSSNYNNISLNIVNNNTLSGINLDRSDDNSLWNNTASKNYNGIYLYYYCNGNDILGNTVNNNTQYGIYLSYYCNGNDILGNNITNNFCGVYLLYGYSNNILSNTISNNTYGIYSVNSRCNEVSGNFFSGNSEDIHGNPEYCPPPEYYYPGLTNIIATVIGIIVIIGICGICVMRGRSKRRIGIKQVIPVRKLGVRLKTTEIAPREKLPQFEIEPEPLPPVEVEEEIVQPEVVPEPIPLAKVEEVVVTPKVALEPIPPVEVEEVVVPPIVAPEPLPPVDIVEEIPMEKVIIGKVARVFEGHGKGISSVAFSPDGNYVVSASNDKTIKIWEISTGKLVKTLEGHKKYVTSVALSSDGKYIVSGSNDRTVKVWEFSTGKLVRTIRGHTWFVSAIAVSPDGNYIISGSFDKDIKVWDINTGDIVRTLEGHKKEVRSVAISPDGEYIASASSNRTLKVWSLETGQIVRTIDAHRKHINSVVFSSDGKHIFSGSNDKTIREWDIATGKLVRTFEGHTWDVLTVAVSLDGNYIVSGSYNKEIKVWDLNTNELVRTLEGHKREVGSVAISPDGKYLVSGSNDKTIKIWKNL